MSTIEEDIQEVAEEAREGFDLKGFLQSRTFRTDSIRLYTDEVAGTALGDARDEDKTVFGTKIGTERIRYGILGEIDALDPEEDGEKIADLKAAAAELKATLEATAITLALQSVPQIVNESATRHAKKALGIKGKVPEDREDDFYAHRDNHLFSNVIKSVSLPSGETKPKLTPSEVGDLRSYLPSSEWTRLVVAITELQFKQAVGTAAVSDADF